MQPRFEEALALLSTDRLGGYYVRSGPNTDRDLLGRYLRNVAVSQALYPYLHAVEVVLRNRINEAVARDHPIDRDRPDLYNEFPCWLDATSTILIPNHQQEVEAAKRSVMRDLRRRFGDRDGRARHRFTPGRLVAKLPFSFWVYLFDPEYVGGGRGQPGILWPRYSAEVFTNRTGAGVVDVRKTLRRLLVVRNRVMHYERITPWDDYSNTALRPEQVRDDSLELLEWMSDRAAAVLRDHGPPDYYFEPVFGRYLRRCAGRI
ncbi:hypothetical protein [Longimicrobium terrae]|uniref:Abi family protein n=1 Tax=Longimicrobium terrae TaxID=1639882 RepID=A0A841GYX0_9BACT|nr:hypothetical protein [Longimicrobium terrae]MBB4636481.1 hypothetical protein [Longimicrobium terrae]MBB6070995.1 hypothetical protein [Longimicrobium terrae]NNC29017.1 hypothetical protein [Longimicrobium terrae]